MRRTNKKINILLNVHTHNHHHFLLISVNLTCGRHNDNLINQMSSKLFYSTSTCKVSI